MYYIAEDQKYVTSMVATDRRLKCQRIINGTNRLMSYLRSSKTTRSASAKAMAGNAIRPIDHQTSRPSDQ